MPNLTQKEITVLKAIDASEYGDNLTDAVWSFTLSDNCDLTPTSIAGVVASLIKKAS